ncbi:SAM-dependent DNA methyltransferase [Streptomyces sp. ISL-1]|nr:SAM-dependent DNA methyltransferase [Streptomyces sp. ISL-1]
MRRLGRHVHPREGVRGGTRGDTSDRFFAGQDVDSGSSVMSTMNMVVHGHPLRPAHGRHALGVGTHAPKADADRYDGVLSTPPFSRRTSAPS